MRSARESREQRPAVGPLPGCCPSPLPLWGRLMKLSLVVAQGVHEGKVIPIPVAQFVIGRDESCQLRPSSPAVSKKHCGLFVKGDQVFARDMGSTNGTFVNEQQITGETEVKDGDHLKVGPLAFVVRLDKAAVTTPVPTKPAEKKTAEKKPAPPA